MKSESRLDVERLQTFVDASRPEFESKLAALVEIPTVSMDPHHEHDVMRGAELAAQYIRAAGGRADVVPTGGLPLVLGERTMAVAGRLLERGFFALGIRPPTVPAGTERIRFSLSAEHTEEQIDRLLDALDGALREHPAR